MSYIHEALKKAQKEKEARHQEYSGLLSARGKGRRFFAGKAAWWTSLLLILLAFTIYSWLDSRGKKTIPTHESLKSESNSRSENPVNAKDFYGRARHFHKLGRLQDARSLYQKALMVDPGYVYALNNLGVIYIQEGNYSEAWNSLENAIKLKPKYVDPYYNLACLYALKGEMMKSLDNLRKAVLLDKSVRDWARKDTDLQNLRGVPGFEEIVGNGGME